MSVSVIYKPHAPWTAAQPTPVFSPQVRLSPDKRKSRTSNHCDTKRGWRLYMVHHIDPMSPRKRVLKQVKVKKPTTGQHVDSLKVRLYSPLQEISSYCLFSSLQGLPWPLGAQRGVCISLSSCGRSGLPAQQARSIFFTPFVVLRKLTHNQEPGSQFPRFLPCRQVKTGNKTLS